MIAMRIRKKSLMKTSKRLTYTYKLYKHDINKFILLLQKCVYPYEYMDDWEKFNGTLLPKKDFYIHLNMENITDVDYMHTKRVRKDFEIKTLGEYNEFYVQSDILLLAGAFNNFQNICLEIYGLDPVHFFLH